MMSIPLHRELRLVWQIAPWTGIASAVAKGLRRKRGSALNEYDQEDSHFLVDVFPFWKREQPIACNLRCVQHRSGMERATHRNCNGTGEKTCGGWLKNAAVVVEHKKPPYNGTSTAGGRMNISLGIEPEG